MHQAIIVIICICILTLADIPTTSQGTTSTTASPAPSKTPTPVASESSSSVTPREQPEQDTLDPFTQSDLTVLTGNVQRPNATIWHNNKLYTVCSGDWTIYELEDTTGSTRTYIYGVRNAHTLFIEDLPSSEIAIWVPDYDTDSLLRVTRNRAPETVTSDLQGPWGITFFDEDSFLITNLTGNSVVLVSKDGEIHELITQLRAPTGITADGDHIYIANNGSARRSIEWISREQLLDNDSDSLQPLMQGLQNTTGLTLASDGLLYFAYALGTRGVVGRVDPGVCREQGGCTNDQVEIVLYTELSAPLAGLTISEDMRLFIHTIFRPEIYWVQLEKTERNQ